MIDISVQSFLKEISSLSPLNSDYEVNITTLCMYIALLQKNANQSINKLTAQNRINFENYVALLDKSCKKIYDKYDVSSKFINNYMIAMKMPKTTDEQMSEYEYTISKLTVEKVNECIEIIVALDNFLASYDNNKALYKDDYKRINNMCVENINNIKNYIIDSVKEISNDIQDPELAFDVMKKLKTL